MGLPALTLLHLLGAHGVVNVAGPIGLAATLGYANWRMARADPASIWTPLFSFRLGVIAFFGVGSLVPYLVDPRQIDRMMRLYAYSSEEAAKTNLVWIFYAALILLFAKFTSLARSASREIEIGKAIKWLTTGRLGAVFFLVGFTYSAVIELGFAMGWFRVVIPGVISTMFQALNAVGIFLIALSAFERKGLSYFLLALALLLSVLLGLVLYNKSVILFPMLLFGLAVMMRRVTLTRALAVAGLLFVALAVLQPSVEHGRNRHSLIYGEAEGGAPTGGSMGERMANVLSYWTDEPLHEDSAGAGIIRLGQITIGAFLIAERDAGIGGDTMSGALYALVPRLIWPDKPMITDVGKDLNYRIFGAETSYIAPTTAADIYWNFGWAGLVLLLPPLGVALWLGTLTSLTIVRRRDWLMMPFVLIAFRIGLNVDQGYVVGMVVPLVTTVIVFYLLRVSKALIGQER